MAKLRALDDLPTQSYTAYQSNNAVVEGECRHAPLPFHEDGVALDPSEYVELALFKMITMSHRGGIPEENECPKECPVSCIRLKA